MTYEKANIYKDKMIALMTVTRKVKDKIASECGIP